VPSWWEFNQTLLAEIVARFIRDSDPPAAMADGVRKLSLADLPIVDISQHVHDAFAGADWFHLLSVLDGTTPNACHIALTTLARAGLLRVVVSTNFDRLVEKAFAWSDQPLDVVVPDRHWQPPGPGGGQPQPCVLMKVHGSVGAGESMIDLAFQKNQGLPIAATTWIERVAATSAVLVIGYSGSDLAVSGDYLGLMAAATSVPWLRWLKRPGSIPHPRAAEIVAACGSRGAFLTGQLPEALAELGIELEHPVAESSAPAPLETRIRQWLSQPHIDGDVCGVLLARLLETSGRTESAAALRGYLAGRLKATVGRGVDIVGLVRASLVIAQLGNDTMDTDRKSSLELLELAIRIDDTIAHEMPAPTRSADAKLEHALNRSGVLLNLSTLRLLDNDRDSAATLRDEAAQLIERVELPQQYRRRSSLRFVDGLFAYLDGDARTALVQWRLSTWDALSSGDRRQAAKMLTNRAMVALQIGEPDLAAVFRDMAAKLVGTDPPTSEPNPTGDQPAGESLDVLIARCRAEAPDAEGRLDEVLTSVFFHLDVAPEQRGWTVDELVRIHDIAEVAALPTLLLLAAEQALGYRRPDATVRAQAAAETWRRAEEPLMLHEVHRSALRDLGATVAQLGIMSHQIHDERSAYNAFVAGARILSVAGDASETERALLYACDALLAADQRSDAEVLLDRIAAVAPRQLLPVIEARRVKAATRRLLATDNPTKGALSELRSRIETLRRFADDTSLGEGLAYASQAEAAVGNSAVALNQAREAKQLLSRTASELQEALDVLIDDLEDESKSAN
jgi:hypothetical protein